MRVLFATQSDGLRMFEALRAELNATVGVEAAGFTVADSFSYQQWLNESPDFEQQGHLLVKEWEVTGARRAKPDPEKLARWEDALGGSAGLFGAIVADRRLFMGPDCAYSQDYRRRFSDDELLCILEAGIEAVQDLFDRLMPDLVVGFVCVTMLDYLVYLVARARHIRVFNIRPTRVGDRIILGSTLNDPDPGFVEAFQRACETPSPRLEEARAYIRRVRERHGRYEGVVRPSDMPAMKVNREGRNPIQAAGRIFRSWRTYQRGPSRHDNHVPNPLRAIFFAAVLNPLRARRARRRLSPAYVVPKELEGRRHLFYPLHTEPEVSLLVYGRPYLNQIEVIRALAISLPADMLVVLKEHPWMVGKRSGAAYAKMLEIPRVRMAPPELDARELIRSADLIAVVTGSVALEAAMLGKPVITFGDCPYNLLPDALVQRCADPRQLPQQLKDLLAVGDRDPGDHALEAYVSAIYETSEGIALYSTLLGKKSVHSERDTDYGKEIEKLSEYLLRRLDDASTLPHAAAAEW